MSGKTTDRILGVKIYVCVRTPTEVYAYVVEMDISLYEF